MNKKKTLLLKTGEEVSAREFKKRIKKLKNKDRQGVKLVIPSKRYH